MGRYFGKIGFVETEETSPGIWEGVITERSYSGEWRRINKNWRESSTGANDNLTISNELSVITDPYILGNLNHMKYVTWLGTKWKISRMEIVYPRMNLTIGEVYNGEEE